MDVGPDGFITPKRPDRGNEAGALGIVARRESNRGGLSDLGIGHKREKVITALTGRALPGASLLYTRTVQYYYKLISTTNTFHLWI
jgi:hypothetical protein